MDFKGFDNVILTFPQLREIIMKGYQDWKNSLSNVNGVYLIVDFRTGKYYVGSAYGTEGFWGRWNAYVHTGHGGNVELKQLSDDMLHYAAQNFQFAILEVCNLNMDKDYVIRRETHWKKALLARLLGLNSN